MHKLRTKAARFFPISIFFFFFVLLFNPDSSAPLGIISFEIFMYCGQARVRVRVLHVVRDAIVEDWI